MATTTLFGISLTLTPPLLTTLRILPLLSASCSYTHAYCELITTSALFTTPPINNSLSVAMSGHDPSTTKLSTSASTKEEEKQAKEVMIPIWFTNFFNHGLYSVITLNSTTVLSSLANLYLFPFPSDPTHSYSHYRKIWITGTLFAVVHFAFAPLVAPSIRALYGKCVRQQSGQMGKEGGKGGKSAEECVREWNGLHRVRMFSVDLVALGCFAYAVVGVLSQGI